MYDPDTARFLIPDPVGFEAGDPNLYRYCKNDPVNHTDPSGNRLLASVTPAWCYSQADTYDWLTPAALWYQSYPLAAGSTGLPARDANNIDLSKTLIKIGDYTFAQLDLFDAYPPETWGKFAAKAQAGTDSLSVISRWIIDSLSKDVVVQWGVPEGHQGDLTPATADLWWWSWEAFLQTQGAKQATIARLRAELEESQRSRIVRAFRTVAGSLRDAANWAGGKLEALGNVVIDAVEDIFLVGLTAILKAASLVISIDPDTILRTIKQFFANVAKFAKQIVRKGSTILGNFFGGIKTGSGNFFAHIESHFKAKVAKWLKLPEPLESLDFNAEWDRYASLILELLGYTWDDLIGLTTDALGADNLAVILDLFEDIKNDIGEAPAAELTEGQIEAGSDPQPRQPSLYKWVTAKWHTTEKLDLSELRPAVSAQLDAVASGIRTKSKDWLIKKIIASFIPGAGVISFIGTLYDVIRWLFEEETQKHLRDLFDTTQTLFQNALDEASEEKIAENTENLWAAAIVPILSGLAALVHWGKVPTRIREFLEHAKDKAQAPVKKILQVASAPIANQLAKWSGDQLPGHPAGSTPLVPPADFGDGRKLWIDQKGKLWVRGSPDQDAAEYIKKRTGGSPPEEIKTAVGAVDMDYKNVASEVAKTKAQPQANAQAAGKKGPVVKDALSKRNTLAEDLKKAAGVLKKLPVCAAKPGGTCWAAGTPVGTPGGRKVSLEAVRLGRRVSTWLPGEAGYRRSAATPDALVTPGLWRAVWLVQERDDGYRLEVGLLRPLGWLAAQRVEKVGDRTELDLPEMGAEGQFQVVAVEPCPEVEPSPGRVVTGVYRHSRGRVYNVRVEGEPRPLGATEGHPVWSADRKGWVPVGAWLVGEHVQVAGRLAAVMGVEERGEEPVFNLEVDADHCYRVGEQGILVHNQSLPRWCQSMTVTPGGGSARDVTRLTTLYFRSQLTQGQITHNPSSLTTTEVPIIKRVRARLAVAPGSGSSTAVRNLFVQMQYWIMGGNYQAALDAGLQNPIGLNTDTVGHIIGDQFGGQGSFPAGSTAVAPDNVFPQSPANQGWYGGIETMWRTSVDAGNTVCVEITLVYRGGTDPARYRPREVRVEWWEDCAGTVTHHALVAQAN